jgi:hypothetical protein
MLWLYLLGNRRAIAIMATDRRAVWIGLLFVLSAGLAREYDGADLVHEPWHLLLPLAASLPTSFLLFLVLFAGVRWGREPAPRFWATYRSFLGLFWMTAPLAWLYATPYERFLDPYRATQANLATLGLVALWRVVLMMRVGVVLHGGCFLAVACRVLLVGSTLLSVGIIYVSPGLDALIELMGGMRGTHSEQLVKVVAQNMLGAGCWSLPVWILIFLFTRDNVARHSALPTRGWVQPPEEPASARGLLTLAVLSLLVWIPILPWTQPEQVNRRRAEQLYLADQLPEFLAELSAHEPEDYPPHWQPPPTRFLPRRHEGFRPWFAILEALQQYPAAPWVRRQYLERFTTEIRSRFIPGRVLDSKIWDWLLDHPKDVERMRKIKEHFGDELDLPMPLAKDANR